MKRVNLNGAFHMDVTMLALKQLREAQSLATEFTVNNESTVVYEIRIKELNGVRMTPRILSKVARALIDKSKEL